MSDALVAVEEELVAAEQAVREAKARLSRARTALFDTRRRCAVCGATDDDNREAGYGPLIDVHVVVSEGEEGQAQPVRFFCEDHCVAVFDGLIALGFGVHRHGGINFLEPQDCPGCNDMDACPTPVRADADGNEWD